MKRIRTIGTRALAFAIALTLTLSLPVVSDGRPAPDGVAASWVGTYAWAETDPKSPDRFISYVFTVSEQGGRLFADVDVDGVRVQRRIRAHGELAGSGTILRLYFAAYRPGNDLRGAFGPKDRLVYFVRRHGSLTMYWSALKPYSARRGPVEVAFSGDEGCAH